MIKTTLAFLVALVLAIGGGAASLAYLLDANYGAGAVTFGPWTAFRSIGAADADPYSRARISREGILALGQSEGLAFVAEQDSAGQRLRFDCAYRIEGTLPPTRFWTMFVEANGIPALNRPDGRPAGIQSRGLVRQADNSLVITVSRHPVPGNWLQVEASGDMRIVATLYDFSLSTQTEDSVTTMPSIVEAGCDA
jgi:hypothetical protein